MSAEFASDNLQRGLHLARVRRFAEAEAAFKDALQGDPENGFVLYQLTLVQWQQDGRERDALATVQQAIRCAPNESEPHALKALIVGNVHNLEFAMGPANEAIRLDPTSPFAWFVRAHLHLNSKQLAKAEADARQALEHDPEHQGAANVLSHALRMQGRVAENTEQIAGMLARNPEDDDNHSAGGWNALQAGRYEQAERHFREALRLNPENEFAREGLIESFRARSRFYRVHLRWSLWMQARSSKMQWVVIIGILVLPRIIRQIFTGPAALVGGLLIGLVLLFVLWVHVARGFGNLIVFTDRFARMALRSGEKLEAVFVGGFIVAALILGAAGVVFGEFRLLLVAAMLVAAAVPFSHTFTNRSPVGRLLFGAIGVFALVAGALFIFQPLIGSVIDAKTAMSLGSAALIFSVLSTWLCNIPGLQRR